MWRTTRPSIENFNYDGNGPGMLAVVVIKDGVCIKQGVSLGTRPSENWKEGLGDSLGGSVPSGLYGVCNY